MRPLAAVAVVLAVIALVAGCGGDEGGASTADPTRRDAAATTCPQQASSAFYIYVENTSGNVVKLRPVSADCPDWSGAGNPTALRMDVPARSNAPAALLQPANGQKTFLWSVRLFVGDMPDGVIGMRLTTKPSDPNAAFESIRASLLLSADGGTWEPDLFTKSGTKYRVIRDTCTASDCFTIRIS